MASAVTYDNSAASKKPRSAAVNLGVATLKLAPNLIKVGFMLLSVAAYSWLFTWKFALIILTAVFLHECGHLFMMKHFGLRTKGIYMIPFFGGAAVAEETFPSRRVEGVTALFSPVVGLALSGVGAGLYFAAGNPIWAAAASWNALINLFNLLPVTPLDGGRVVKSVIVSLNSRLNTVVYLLMTALAVYIMVTQRLWIFIILLALGSLEFFFDRKRPDPLPRLSTGGAWLLFAGYATLVAALWAVMLIMAHEPGAAAAMLVLQG